MASNVIAIDQGTTSSRAIIFDESFKQIGVGQEEFTQHFPQSGWVEHDPEEIWDTTLNTVKLALEKASLEAKDVAAIGITNQRETTIVWDRQTGVPIYNAIVWQDRRTADACTLLKQAGLEDEFRDKTGLLLDPYFSGTKLAWILDNVDGARARAEKGELAFGTVDTFLLWRLTGGRVHATDATNASRTLMYNIKDGAWDDSLLSHLNIPRSVLPAVMDSAASYGVTDKVLFGAEIEIAGIAGDQQAALIGQACFHKGSMKSTYGTGCFAMLNTGADCVQSNHKLITTIAYQLRGKTTYAIEGSIFIAGAAVQWLRDGLGIIEKASESGDLANQADPNQQVYLVPAFVGLGAPYWDPEARGAIFGLTRSSGPAEFAKATLESVCYQTNDLMEAMKADSNVQIDDLRVDGGMVASDWTMQRLSDLLNIKIDRPTVLETTALGAAWLAGMHVGVWPEEDGFSKTWRLDQQFTPKMTAEIRSNLLNGWSDAVSRTLSTQ
jgi:glycerol kinase